MIHKLSQWANSPLSFDGAIVGCAQNHEWLLPWWWMHFCVHNTLPVAFVDFGDLSDKAKAWCAKRGKLLALQPIEQFITPRDRVDSAIAREWESDAQLDPWKARAEWFKKPLACLQSPFRRAIWIDLDCQVRKPLEPLYEWCENEYSIALAEEPPSIREQHAQRGLIAEGQMEYNSGVVVFKHGADIIRQWVQHCLENNSAIRGDQEALSHLAHIQGFKLPLIPPIYNWRGNMGISRYDFEAVAIIHWLGIYKKLIKDQMHILSNMGVDLTL